MYTSHMSSQITYTITCQVRLHTLVICQVTLLTLVICQIRLHTLVTCQVRLHTLSVVTCQIRLHTLVICQVTLHTLVICQVRLHTIAPLTHHSSRSKFSRYWCLTFSCWTIFTLGPNNIMKWPRAHQAMVPLATPTRQWLSYPRPPGDWPATPPTHVHQVIDPPHPTPTRKGTRQPTTKRKSIPNPQPPGKAPPTHNHQERHTPTRTLQPRTTRKGTPQPTTTRKGTPNPRPPGDKLHKASVRERSKRLTAHTLTFIQLTFTLLAHTLTFIQLTHFHPFGLNTHLHPRGSHTHLPQTSHTLHPPGILLSTYKTFLSSFHQKKIEHSSTCSSKVHIHIQQSAIHHLWKQHIIHQRLIALFHV